MNGQKKKIAVVVAATITLLLLGVMYAWSMFRIEIAKVFPDFAASQLSMNFTIAMIAFCLGGFAGGKISGRFSPRVSARVAAVLIFVGYMGVSFMGHFSGAAALAVLYVFYGAFVGFGTGIGYNACVGTVPMWFPQRIGIISGTLLMGFGVGSLVLGLAVEALSPLITVFNVFRIYAVALALALLVVSCFLEKPPAAAKPGAETDDTGSVRPTQMLTRLSFWLYFLWNVIASCSGLLIMNSAANISVFFGAAAGLGLVVSLFNGIGRPVTGAVMDKMGQFKGMLIMNGVLVTAGVMLLVTAFTGSLVTMVIGLLGVGVVYGGGVTISAKVINDLYGPRYYAVNYSLSNFCMIPASFLGPYISGLLQDSSGDYTSTFVMLVAMAVMGFALILLLKMRLKKEQAVK